MGSRSIFAACASVMSRWRASAVAAVLCLYVHALLGCGNTQQTSVAGGPQGVVIEAESVEAYYELALLQVSNLYVGVFPDGVVTVRYGFSPHMVTTRGELYPYLLALQQRSFPYRRILLCVEPNVTYGAFFDILWATSRVAQRTVLNPPPFDDDFHVNWDDPSSPVAILDARSTEHAPCYESADRGITSGEADRQTLHM